MKGLLRLYPRSWRERYGREMEVLLAAQGSAASPAVAELGPIRLAVFTRPHLFGGLGALGSAVWTRTAAIEWLLGAAVLATLIAALALVLASPRLLKSLR